MSDTKKYFIDTEFHEHKRPVKFLGITIRKVWTIDLISIGIVCEDGRSYYAINRDLNHKYAKRNPWLKENVLDKLPPKRPQYPPSGSPRIYQESMRWLPMSQIREEVIEFCGGKPEWDEGGDFYIYPSGTPEFYAYYADYDWVAFCWMFGTMMDLPNGFPMYCRDLKQMLDEKAERLDWMYGRDCWNNKNRTLDTIGKGDCQEKDRPATLEEKLKTVKELVEYPVQKEEHNALSDARWNLELFKFIQKLR